MRTKTLLSILLSLSTGPALTGEPPLLSAIPRGFAIVDVKPFCNMGWTDEQGGDGEGGWSDQGENDMPNAPVGLRDCRGIPCDIIDAEKNNEKSVIVLKSGNLTKGLPLVAIPLKGARAEYVYVLQAAAWLRGGAAKFTLIYEDGSKSKTLQAWENIRVCNWWRPTDGAMYKVAFVTKNAVCDAVGMVVMVWRNAKPEKALKSLLIESYNKDTVMIIAGVTLSQHKEIAFKSDRAVLVLAAKGNARSSPKGKRPRYRQKFFYPPLSAHEDNRNYRHVHAHASAYKKLLENPDRVERLAESLLADEEQNEIYSRVLGPSHLVEHEEKAEWPLIGEVFDRLQEKGELRATITAADLLLKTVATASASGRRDRRIAQFPDGLCERAAGLLDHADPVVQAMAEWMLSLRFKKQNRATNRLSGLFPEKDRQKPWSRKWWSRQAESFLTDDYCRQLVHVDRHRALSGLETEVDKIEGRMRRLLGAPSSYADGTDELRQAFSNKVRDIRSAMKSGDLLAAHQAYPALRRSARALLAAVRRDFPREGVAFMTQCRIPGGDWNVNMAVTTGTNMPGGDIHWKEGSDPADGAVPFGLQQKIGAGSPRGIDLSWEADKTVFSYWNQPIDPKIVPHGWNTHENAHIYELDVASGKIQQLTNSPGDNDIEPCYLPNGDVIFASDCSSFGNQCAGSFIQDKRCTTLSPSFYNQRDSSVVPAQAKLGQE